MLIATHLIRKLENKIFRDKYGKSKDKHSIRHKFNEHRANSAKRGIEFTLSIEEWWSIWNESGHWNDRGIGDPTKYVMARHNDSGAYSVGNVYITLCGENTKDGFKFRSEKIKGFYVEKATQKFYSRFRAKRLGTFETAEEARQAYLNAKAQYEASRTGSANV
jgi:hypothetical protein